MKGITNLYSYIPKYRIEVKEINKAWSNTGGKGRRSVANYDEDVITMGVQAAIDNKFSSKINTLVLATTSSPFKEESAASIVTYTLGLEDNCRAINVNQSVNGGLSSLSLMSEGQLNDSSLLIIASDVRSTQSGSVLEKEIGDASCAVEVGTDQVLAEIIAQEQINDFGYQTWQKSNDMNLSLADDKFSNEIRTRHYVELANKTLKAGNIKLEELSYLIVADRNERMAGKIADLLGRKDLAVSSELAQSIGYTGTSMPFLLLNEVFIKAKAGDLILCMQSGSGAESILVKVTEEIKKFQEQNNLKLQIEQGIDIKNYQEFLQMRNVVERSELRPYSTLAYLRRERDVNLRLAGQTCESCGAIHFPKQVLCRSCKTRMGDANTLLKHRGEIFTFTNDHVFPGQNASLSMAVIDLDEGGRIFTQMTDVLESEMEIGIKVRLVFRKFHEGAGYPNYFWKGTIQEKEVFS